MLCTWFSWTSRLLTLIEVKENRELGHPGLYIIGLGSHNLLVLSGAGLAAQVPDRAAHADLVLPDPRGPLPSLRALPQQRPRRRRHAVHQLLAQHAGPGGRQKADHGSFEKI